ncbi:aminoglycoside phosphotransferase family protein [Kitasatospora sp. NPDC086801]|uniref:aminoglycoside phosphotransferase family protein n=1 Tax=Kitasatospora sp. NPDC086801 TaxID=3364066 RepID=UPI003810009C
MTDISADLVLSLVREQFPEWGDLPVRPVERQGWDNRTFRLGDELTVRLPSAEGYVAGVEKEDRCLPLLSPHLPVPIPVPVGVGRPTADYPFPWSVRRWLPGTTVDAAADIDRTALARDLGAFLVALRKAPTERGPVGGRHSGFRGCHPSVYGDDVQHALGVLEDSVDVGACRTVWADALRSAWPSAPVWFHGDVAVGNLLTRAGQLSAVIDFGTCGIGDPACDLVMAWTYFAGEERQVFRQATGLADDTWRRARGWALWKPLLTMALRSGPEPEGVHERVIAEILNDPVV